MRLGHSGVYHRHRRVHSGKQGVRCALCLNEDMAEMCRRHNDANVLALGQKYVDSASAEKIVDRFLHTSFDGGRHRTRVDKIESV